MIDGTDRQRFQPRMQMPMQRPQFDMGMDMFDQPTQVAPPMEPPAMQQLKSVLKPPPAEENIRRLIEQMKGYEKPGFMPYSPPPSLFGPNFPSQLQRPRQEPPR